MSFERKHENKSCLSWPKDQYKQNDSDAAVSLVSAHAEAEGNTIVQTPKSRVIFCDDFRMSSSVGSSVSVPLTV